MVLSYYLLTLLVVEIVIHLFHLSMLVLMIAERKTTFKGPFFNIFRTILVTDLLFYLSITFLQKVSLISFVMEFLKENVYIASIQYVLLNFFTVAQFLGHLFLALNRFTLIWFPLKHECIWRRHWYTAAILGLSFLNISWRIHESAIYMYGADNSVWVAYLDNNVTDIVNVLLTTIFFSTTCFAAILNVLTFAKFFIRKQHSPSLNVKEKKLLYVSFVLFIAQLFRVSYNFGRLLFSSDVQIMSFLTFIAPYLNDTFALSGSVSLLVLSNTTREAYKSFYIYKFKHQIHPMNSTTQKIFAERRCTK